MNIDDIKYALKNYSGRELYFMEVCGSHTAAIEQNGIKSLLSPKIKLIAGPGCPVCVTPSAYIDRICELASDSHNVICSFGDMIRVPGSSSSLAIEKGKGADIRMLYSPLEMIDMAKKEPNKKFIFAAVGFETTTPLYALLIDTAVRENIKNVQILSSIKTMPEAIKFIAKTSENLDGFIAPGHVAVISGAKEYETLAMETGLPFCISGFRPEEILYTIYGLVKSSGKPVMKNLYPQVVSYEGNKKARDLIDKYFEKCDSVWRGLGLLPKSGKILKEEYADFDAGSRNLSEDNMNPLCICGDILCGKKEPEECRLFGKKCTPTTPVGACMVSYEGTCFQRISSI